MLLTIDIGNSHTVVGIWQEACLKAACRFLSNTDATVLQWQQLLLDCLEKNSIEKQTAKKNFKVVIASVVPQIKQNIVLALEPYTQRTFFVNANVKLPFRFDYLGTATLGEDRIANAVATSHYYGENAVIIDFGTAITFCLLINNVYKGGIILPGVYTAMDSLTKKTSQLPQVQFSVQKNILAQTTQQAMEKGMFFGCRAMIKELVSQFCQQATLQGACPAKVIATGGMVEQLGFSHEFFDVVDTNLTLRGLYQLYMLNL